MDANTLTPVAEAVWAHADRNYDTNFGWSVIVECWTIAEIVDHLLDCHIDTVDIAIKEFESLTEIWDDRYMDAINSAF